MMHCGSRLEAQPNRKSSYKSRFVNCKLLILKSLYFYFYAANTGRVKKSYESIIKKCMVGQRLYRGSSPYYSYIENRRHPHRLSKRQTSKAAAAPISKRSHQKQSELHIPDL